MKKSKSQWKEILMDAIGELVIYLIFFGLGALVMGWFGVDVDADNVDGDLFAIVGIGVFAVIGAVIIGVHAITKRKKTNKAPQEETEEKS